MHYKQDFITEGLRKYTLTNDHKMSVSILNLGGIITAIKVPDQNGKLENIVLSYADDKQYLDDPNYFGALIGPIAGRVPHAKLFINDQKYNLDKNNGGHHLHGGQAGFNKVYWDVTPFQDKDCLGLELYRLFGQAELGNYPGPLKVKVIYSLTNENVLKIKYEVDCEKTSYISLTNHTYFNLTGNSHQTIENHHVQMNSQRFIALDTELIPTGEWLNVDNVPTFDFRKGQKIICGIKSQTAQNKIVGNGYDHYFYLDPKDRQIHISEQTSGRKLLIETSQPGLVMYTSNGMTEGLRLKSGDYTQKHQGICFETQGLPLPFGSSKEYFPSNILQADEKYIQETTFKFYT